jgi:hypothetical protein
LLDVTFPRPLTQREREVIEALLPAGAFPDVETYRAQLEHVSVVGGARADLHLDVDPGARRASFQESPLPIEGVAPGPDRADEFGLMLWAKDGALSGVEMYWTGDTVPEELPEAHQLKLVRFRTVPGKPYRAPEDLGDHA